MRGDTTQTASEGKKANRKWLWWIAGAALVIALPLLWCLIFHLQGESQMRREDYTGAMDAFSRDFLFGSDSYREATRMAGEQLFDAGDFVKAERYFRMLGDEGESRGNDCIYERGVQLLAEGEVQNAINTFRMIEGEERAARQIDAANLAIAWQFADAGYYEDAILMVETIKYPDTADPTQLLDLCCRSLGAQAMEEKDYQGALLQYDKCRQDAEAAGNAEILAAMLEGDYLNAAQMAREYQTSGQTDWDLEYWYELMEELMGNWEYSGPNECLPWLAAEVIMSNGPEMSDEELLAGIQRKVNTNSRVWSINLSSSDKWACVISSPEELARQCGAAPQGKVLIVRQSRSFPNREVFCTISFEAMRVLPEELIPLSLDEVEYIVTLSYDYSRWGTYSMGTAALKENGRVKVIKLPGSVEIYSSSLLQGENPPSTIKFYGSPPPFETGRAPDLSQEVFNALLKIMGEAKP